MCSEGRLGWSWIMKQPKVSVSRWVIRAERREKSSTSDQLWENRVFDCSIQTLPPSPLSRRTVIIQEIHHSGELLASVHGPYLRLELVLGIILLPGLSRCSWWILKQLTLWPISRWANSTTSKVLCQEKYWFHVLCCLGQCNSSLPPSVSGWKEFNISVFLLCSVAKQTTL